MNRILNFHLVNDAEWFDKTIALIKSKYNMVGIDTLEQYYEGKIDLKNACHITVDDGDESFYRIIYPVLKKHNVPASLYVSPKVFKERINYWFQEIEGYDRSVLCAIIADITNTPLESLQHFPNENLMKVMPVEKIHEILVLYRQRTNTPLKHYQNMTIDELKLVDREGLTVIGAHTMNHPILHNETDAVSDYEITNSITELSELLGHDIKCFSYPNGIPCYDFTDRERDCLKRNGITIAFSTEARSFKATDNRYSIPRLGVSNLESALFLNIKLLVGPLWLLLKKFKPSGEYINRAKLKKVLRIN